MHRVDDHPGAWACRATASSVRDRMPVQLAIAVIDDLQNRGVADCSWRRSPSWAADSAAALGLRRLPAGLDDGTLRVTCPLNQGDLLITDEDILADLLY